MLIFIFARSSGMSKFEEKLDLTLCCTEKQATALNKKGIETIQDLHRYFPLRYIDCTKEDAFSLDRIGSPFTSYAILKQVDERISSAQCIPYLYLLFESPTFGVTFSVSLFRQTYMYNYYAVGVGKQFVVSGKLQYDTYKAMYTITAELIRYDNMYARRIVPVFHAVKGISKNMYEKIVTKALKIKETDYVPKLLQIQEGVENLNRAIEDIVFPESAEAIEQAQKRFIVDDLYQLAYRMEMNSRMSINDGMKIHSVDVTEQVIFDLPYKLTRGQFDAVRLMIDKFREGARFKALVQGDVGCGKSIVAFLGMILAAENGYQAILMAPTKILAEQHYKNLTKILEGTRLQAYLATGGKVLKKDAEAIANGECRMIVGTSSVLSSNLKYSNLGLLIVDEEHKFGVAQKRAIEERVHTIDYISMSATPIPRTLAMSLYGGDTEIICIKDKPVGRKPVKTYKISNQSAVIGNVNAIVKNGGQVYIVCPMIEPGEEGSIIEKVSSTKDVYKTYSKIFGADIVAELTGATGKERTKEVLNAFQSGKIKILIATTVVEVGVDVPNANLIVIYNAERFGLASLHQLRGRVGRGSKQAFCIAYTEKEDNERLDLFVRVTDGFVLADYDMRYIRKTGEMFGLQQSGRNFVTEELMANPELYERIKTFVQEEISAEEAAAERTIAGKAR